MAKLSCRKSNPANLTFNQVYVLSYVGSSLRHHRLQAQNQENSRTYLVFLFIHDNEFSIYLNLNSPLNRMLRALSKSRRCRRISRRGLLLLSAALLVLAVTLFYIIPFPWFKPVKTIEALSLPEEFLSPFHTGVSNHIVDQLFAVNFNSGTRLLTTSASVTRLAPAP